MTRALTAVVTALTVASTFAGQQPADDFPIVEKQYRDGSRSLFYLHSPYGFVAIWEDGKTAFYVYDKGQTNITMTSDLKTFVGLLLKIPDGSEVDWVNTCCAPLHYGMPKQMLSQIEETLKKKRFKMATVEDNHFILCTCDTTNLVFLTNALPTGSANQKMQRTGASRSAQETNRTSSAAGSRR
jgi:hypothetical protein